MLKKILRSKKNFTASLLIVATLFLTIFTLFMSDFFQNPEVDQSKRMGSISLLTSEEIAEISKIQVENRLGSFLIEKKGGTWLLLSPKRLMAQNEMVTKLLKVIEDIKVKKMLHLDPINLANYSLDAPELKIKFWNSAHEERLLKIGVINPIDNTSFMTLSGEDSIFQTESSRAFIEKLDLSSLLTSQIFSLKEEMISKIALKQNGTELLSWKNEGETEWVGSKGEKISSERVANYFEKLAEIRSSLVADQLGPNIKNELEELLKNPKYELIVTFNDDEEIRWQISGTGNRSKELSIESGGSFIIRSSEVSHPYIVPESQAALITNF